MSSKTYSATVSVVNRRRPFSNIREVRASIPRPRSLSVGYRRLDGVKQHAVQDDCRRAVDERAFVLYDWMAGYGAEPTRERLIHDSCERQLVAITVRCCVAQLREIEWHRTVIYLERPFEQRSGPPLNAYYVRRFRAT